MLSEWCEKTSLNGIADLYDSRYHKRRFLFWSIVMLIMLVLTVYLTILNIFSFFFSPTVTSISTEADNSIQMPELLLCYNGGLNHHKMRSMNLPEDVIDALQFTYLNPPFPDRFNYSTLQQQLDSFMMVNNMETVEQFLLQTTSFTCDDIVQSRMPAGNISKEIKCDNVSNFLGYEGTSCLLMRENGQQHWPGPDDGGLRLRISSPTNANVSSYKNRRLRDSFSLSVNKKIVIAMPNVINIPLNHNTIIYLSLVKHFRLKSSGQCLDDTRYTSSNSVYFRCLAKGVRDTCNCTFPGITTPSLDGELRMCSVFEFRTKCSFNKIMEIAGLCARQQKPLCVDDVYHLSTNFEPVANLNNQSDIRIVFDYMQYTKIEEVQAVTWDMAVANVGGQAGLWMGCSIVTIIQALQYIFLAFYRYICKTTPKATELKIDNFNSSSRTK